MGKNVSQSGFTLVELLVAIIVGGVLVTSVNTIYTNQLYLTQLSRDTVLANAYVEGKVESLRSRGYLSVPTGTTSITSELPSELNAPRTGTMVVSAQSASVKRVVITISYNQQGTNQTFSYTTYLGELGVGQ